MARQSRALPVLITRPEPQGRRFAADLAARFGDAVTAVSSPLMVRRLLPADLPDQRFSAIILTSETGAEAAGLLRAHLPDRAYAVGGRTARAAAAAGFAAATAGGDADALIDLILSAQESGPLLHLCGEDTRGDIAGRLSAAGVQTRACTVYRQEPCAMSPAGRAVLAQGQPVILPLFSPRSAGLFHLAAADSHAPLRIAAISAATAQAATVLGPARMAVAHRPDSDAMLDAIATLLDDTP